MVIVIMEVGLAGSGGDDGGDEYGSGGIDSSGIVRVVVVLGVIT